MLPQMFKIIQKNAITILTSLVFGWTIYSVYRIVSSSAPDFSVLWLASKDLIINKNPYLNPEIFTGVGYPPNTLLFYLPLTLIPYKVAQGIFVISSLVATVACCYLSFKICLKKFSKGMFLGLLALTLFSFPSKFNLGMGQNNTIALLLLLLSYYLYRNGKINFAGILLGLSFTLKTVFVFFILFFLLKRQWKLVLYSLVPLMTSIAIVGYVSNLELYKYYFTVIVPSLLNLVGREIYYNQGIIGFVSRLSGNLDIRRYVTLLISVIVVWVTSHLAAINKKDENLSFALFVTTLPLIDTYSWQHHFVWLIFPFVVLVTYLVKFKNLHLWILLGISYFLVGWNFKNPRDFFVFPANLLLSNTFYGAILLYFLILTLGRKSKLYKSNLRE